MRALVYTLERTLDVLDVETPVPDAGEVLIRVERVGICGSDVQGVATRSPRRAPPLIMGHELIGEVTAAAPGAEALVGRRVAVNPQVPCRACLALPLRVARTSASTASSSAGAAPAASASSSPCRRRCVHVIDDELDADVAVLAEPVATCIHAFRLSPLALPATVVVLGAGTIGTLTCIVARLLGAGRIVVSETDEERRAWAVPHRGRGGPAGRARARPWALAARELVVDAVGSDATRAASVALLQPGGCAIWLGMHDMEATIPAFDLVVREQSIRGSFAYTDADFARAVELLAEHPQAFRVPTRTCSLEEGARPCSTSSSPARRAGSSRRRWRREVGSEVRPADPRR